MADVKKRVCVIGAGPSGMSALFHFAKQDTGCDVEIVCYEKQKTWGGMWNFSWRTGTDEYGEPCHAGMYKHLWSNSPKECLEFPDYTFEDHFGKAVPSYPPRPAMRDYLQGRWESSSKDLKQFIQFNTVVRLVQYNEADDNFTVRTTNLESNASSVETFTHVIVAVGIFNAPNIPSFPGIEAFEGRILHSHNYRDAKEFKGQRLLVIGSHYSAEDIGMQCLKYGAKSIVCSWRTKPMGFKFPKGMEERPLVQRFDSNNAYFKDGTSAEIDAVVLCTGYLYTFPFLEERLRLKSGVTMYPAGLYKGSMWLGGGNNKLFYAGIQDQYYSFTMFDVQALWICKYILGQFPEKPLSEMQKYSDKWVDKLKPLKDCHDDIDYQTEFMEDLVNDTGYSPKATDARPLFHDWEDHKVDNILTFRDRCFASIFTGTMSPEPSCKWWEAFDDSIKVYTNC